MKDVLITAVRKTEYKDLMEQYENPIEHACDVKVGDVFVSKTGKFPTVFAKAHGTALRLLSKNLRSVAEISSTDG